MRDNYTHISLLLDKSASMSSKAASTIEAVNEYIKANQNDGTYTTFTLAQFGSQYTYTGITRMLDINHVASLNNQSYRADGYSTALLDSLGRLIKDTGDDLGKLSEDQRPSKVLFVYLTDGLENSSVEFSKQAVTDLIEHQKTVYSWEFVALGTTLSSVNFAENLGISNRLQYTDNSKGVADSMRTVLHSTTSYKAAGASYNAGTFFDSSVDTPKKVEDSEDNGKQSDTAEQLRRFISRARIQS